MKHKLIYITKWFILLVFAILSAGYIYALGTQSTGFQTTTVAQLVDFYDPCTTVRHTGSNSFFVPTNTSSEWNFFKNNSPSSVMIETQDGGFSAETLTSGREVNTSQGDFGTNIYYLGFNLTSNNMSGLQPTVNIGSITENQINGNIIHSFHSRGVDNAYGFTYLILAGNHSSTNPFDSVSINGTTLTASSATKTYESSVNKTSWSWPTVNGTISPMPSNGSSGVFSVTATCS